MAVSGLNYIYRGLPCPVLPVRISIFLCPGFDKHYRELIPATTLQCSIKGKLFIAALYACFPFAKTNNDRHCTYRWFVCVCVCVSVCVCVHEWNDALYPGNGLIYNCAKFPVLALCLMLSCKMMLLCQSLQLYGVCATPYCENIIQNVLLSSFITVSVKLYYCWKKEIWVHLTLHHVVFPIFQRVYPQSVITALFLE